ncbi:MAG: hypothetical protein R6U78_11455 [Bacteroidales bacterium]
MGYSHRGKVLDNGAVDTGVVMPVKDREQSAGNELAVRPEDDGLHVTDFNRGDFEWWYFDILDRDGGIFLKIVMHIGTDPLKTRVFPRLAISVNTPEISESLTQSYSLGDLEADTRQCGISVRDEIRIRSEPGGLQEYFIEINHPQFSCDLRFTERMEGWKPLGKEVHHRIGKKKGAFSWVIPLPVAKVDGEFSYGNNHYTIRNCTGYHDHNYIRVYGEHPLHLDQLVTRWYWGKCYAGRYTVVFMDTRCRTHPTRSVMVAEDSRIIYSANNLVDCSVVSTGYDDHLRVKYPSSLLLRSTDEQFHFEAFFEYERMLDRKDLLEDVNPVLKFLIKKMVTRPAYQGILAGVSLKLNGRKMKGYGNYESMVFRNR